MEQSTIAVKVDKPVYELYHKLKKESPEGTNKAFFTKVFNAFANGDSSAANEAFEKLQTDYQELKQRFETIMQGHQEKDSIIAQLREENENMRSGAITISDNLEQYQSRIEELEQSLTDARENAVKLSPDNLERMQKVNPNINAAVEYLCNFYENPPVPKNSENTIVLTLSPVVNELLNITADRLSTRLNQNVTPEKILSDMFLRYTKEQNAEWFYPFVISASEFKTIIQRHKAPVNAQ